MKYSSTIILAVVSVLLAIKSMGLKLTGLSNPNRYRGDDLGFE